GENLFTVDGSDPYMTDIYNTPTFRRMYWRALQELVQGPLDTTQSGPLMESKYNVFTENGLSAEDPAINVMPWLQAAQSSIASQLATEKATSSPVTATVTPKGPLGYVSGVAFSIAS